jgi:hypothetical protein
LPPRKSTPSVKSASASGESRSLVVCASALLGHENVPCSSRLRPATHCHRMLRRS